MMVDLGTAVGVASLGAQVCQGLLSYYDTWKSYSDDILQTYSRIESTTASFTMLKDRLKDRTLDADGVTRVVECTLSCQDTLKKLETKLGKLQSHRVPAGLRQKAWAEAQRLFYPFRASTLAKLQELVGGLLDQVALALQILHLDVSITGNAQLSSIHQLNLDARVERQDIASKLDEVRDAQQAAKFEQLLRWLSPPDPSSNHFAARKKHHSGTGAWLLKSDQYTRWRTSQVQHLWLYGKAGCGKSVLCSTAIEDVKTSIQQSHNTALAMFYFSFSESRKQTWDNLLRSLAAQLCRKDPGFVSLQQIHDKSNACELSPDRLESILLFSMAQSNEVLIFLDALDEIPEDDNTREEVLDGLQRLARGTPQLKIFATSRQLSAIERGMRGLEAESIQVESSLSDADIGIYVDSMLEHDVKLFNLDEDTKCKVRKTFKEKAGGMFRWAYCQLEELRKLRSFKAKFVTIALETMPLTLDATYERMLTAIPEIYREQALVALQWLAFSERPLSLLEMREACIVDPSGEGAVDFEDRGGLRDVLEILPGLVVVDKNTSSNNDAGGHDTADDCCGTGSQATSLSSCQVTTAVDGKRKIRLAHFSVKEYLVSNRILKSEAKWAALDQALAHRFLAHSCLCYLVHYSDSSILTRTLVDLSSFPLLEYAAANWYLHSNHHSSNEVRWELRLLSSAQQVSHWIHVYEPETRTRAASPSRVLLASGLYYASFLGLHLIIELLKTGADVNARGGRYGSALQAASYSGHEKIVEVLLAQGADVNARGGRYGSALGAAALRGHEKVVEVLLAQGANANAEGGRYYGSALGAAALRGHEKVVELLLAQGIDVTAEGGKYYGSALEAAALRGHEKVVEVLLAQGIDVNAEGGRFYRSALHAASSYGHEKVVEVLLAQSAGVNAKGGRYYSSALRAASSHGHMKIVDMLLANSAEACLIE